MKRKLSILLAFMTLTVALCGCAGDKKGKTEKPTSQENPGTPSTTVTSQITIGIPQDIEDTLDPHKILASGTKEIFFNIYEGLVKPDSDGNLVPAVASEYKASEDCKTYTFTLREGVKFHDNSIVTADDVIYSINRCADATDGDPLVPAFSNIESVTKVDESTIEIQLTNPDPEFIVYCTTAIIPASNADPASKAIGTGPYKYVSRSPQESITLVAFDGYWAGEAKLKDVTFKIIADSDMIVTNLKSGAIDMFCRITSSQADEISGNKNYNVLEGTMNLVQALYLNNDYEPFRNELVRKALCYAVDREEILEFMADGKGTIVGSSMYPAFGRYYMSELVDEYPCDVNKAKDLLAEAGYADGFSFTITVPSNYQQHVDTAMVIVEQLKKVGINATIDLVEWETWLSEVYSGRKYQATVVGVDASQMTASAMLRRFTSTAGNNFVNFNDEQYDAAFANANATADAELQTQYYKECEEILCKRAANVYIQDMANLVALNKKYDGFKFYPLYIIDLYSLYAK